MTSRTDSIILRMSRNWFGNPPQWFVDAINELRRLAETEICLRQWIEKTDWIRDEPWIGPHLGRHVADAMSDRIRVLESQNEALRAEIERMKRIKSCS